MATIHCKVEYRRLQYRSGAAPGHCDLRQTGSIPGRQGALCLHAAVAEHGAQHETDAATRSQPGPRSLGGVEQHSQAGPILADLLGDEVRAKVGRAPLPRSAGVDS